MRVVRFVAAAALVVAASTAAPLGQTGAPPAGREEIVEDIVAWVNDDVVLLSEIIEQEQLVVAQLVREQSMTAEQVEARLADLRNSILLDMIWNRLLVQEAEQLFSIEGMKEDLIDQFMQRNQLSTTEELDSLLREQVGMTREELGDRLLLSAAPDYVVQTQVRSRLGVSEEEARAHYDAHGEEFTTPASVTFRELVLLADEADEKAEARERIAAIAGRARSGEDFVELVRELSEAPSKAIDGEIGPIDPADLIEEIGAAVTKLEPGVVSEPIETDQGWHLLRVESRQDQVTQPFAEVLASCEEAVRRQKMEVEYRDFVTGLWEASTVEVRRAYAEGLPQPWRDKATVRD